MKVQKTISITPKTRKKFKKWLDALNKLSEQEKKQEVEAWITSALNILNENEKIQ